MNPPDSYRSDLSYAPSEHDSRKSTNDDQCRGSNGYASSPCAPRICSDHVIGYGSGMKGYGSNLKCHHNSIRGIQDGSLKNFVNDDYGNGRGEGNGSDGISCVRNGSHHSSVKESGSDHGIGSNVGDTRGSSDCGYDGHYSSGRVSTETHQDIDYMSDLKDYGRPGMSWVDRRSFHLGEPCAIPLDWDSHPTLRQVPPDEHQTYRHSKLEEWLSTAHKRRSKETFGAYIWRASALANSELRHRKKQCWGDEYRDPLDKFVMRLFYGMKLRLERTESVVLGVDDETGILDILREECEELSKRGQLSFDQRSIQYNPLIMSERLDRSSNNGY